MRVTMILLALITTPYLTSVSQAQGQSTQQHGLGHDAQHCAMRAALHPDKVINKCDPPPPPQPPPSCPTTVLSLGTASITGKVTDAATATGLPNWCIEVSGVSVDGLPISATAATLSDGTYSFTGLPGGTYSVCEDVQTGWTLVFPSITAACPGGTYWTFDLADGDVGALVNFRNTFP